MVHLHQCCQQIGFRFETAPCFLHSQKGEGVLLLFLHRQNQKILLQVKPLLLPHLQLHILHCLKTLHLRNLMEEPASFRVLVTQSLFSTFRFLAYENQYIQNMPVPKNMYHYYTKNVISLFVVSKTAPEKVLLPKYLLVFSFKTKIENLITKGNLYKKW